MILARITGVLRLQERVITLFADVNVFHQIGALRDLFSGILKIGLTLPVLLIACRGSIQLNNNGVELHDFVVELRVIA